MEIKSAEFLISNTDYRKCPTNSLPEFAFIGRSNVGKSSLINMLTGRKALAMTSSTPFPHQQGLASGGSSRIWLRQTREVGYGGLEAPYRKLCGLQGTTDLPVCLD